ncbi:unnamed protein product [marine sediment metagenome]|uniref:Uncharacterized protein n=1 Tax=marine sediment metagenome TaxID=412755 RepID=X1MEF4_9ZZZZ
MAVVAFIIGVLVMEKYSLRTDFVPRIRQLEDRTAPAISKLEVHYARDGERDGIDVSYEADTSMQAIILSMSDKETHEQIARSVFTDSVSIGKKGSNRLKWDC